MALKDWKRSTSGRRFRKGGEYLLITKVGERDGYKKGYTLYLDTKDRDTRKWFKTKSQALKYAKAYMKKH